MADDRGLLRLRPDHEARRIAQGHDRDVEGVAELHEARRLVAGRRIDRTAEMLWIVGDQAERFALDTDESRDHAGAEIPPDLQNRALISEQIDHRSDVV